MRSLYLTLFLISAISACSLRDLVAVDENAIGRAVDPSVVTTYNGAVALYNSAIGQAAYATAKYTWDSGLMTDEQRSVPNVSTAAHDARAWHILPEAGTQLFSHLSKVRIFSQQALEALQRFPTMTPRAYIGELYALQGFAEVLLSEGYCSGVPLGKAPLGGGWEYGRGLTTRELLEHALTTFDSAMAYSQDSIAISTLARIGQARAWSNLGDYNRAADAAAAVDRGSYSFTYLSENNSQNNSFLRFTDRISYNFGYIEQREGENGLAWLAATPEAQDPRVPVTTENDPATGTLRFTVPTRSAKLTPQTTAVVVASDIEAQLIIAEAQLQPAANPGGPWLETLNVLRRSIGLVDTTDPGNATDRVNLLFRERAFWLYGTGHRQGDMRRLIRQYGRTIQTTYPYGYYYRSVSNDVIQRYGDLVTLTPGGIEVERNPLYSGCENRDP